MYPPWASVPGTVHIYFRHNDIGNTVEPLHSRHQWGRRKCAYVHVCVYLFQGLSCKKEQFLEMPLLTRCVHYGVNLSIWNNMVTSKVQRCPSHDDVFNVISMGQNQLNVSFAQRVFLQRFHFT